MNIRILGLSILLVAPMCCGDAPRQSNPPTSTGAIAGTVRLLGSELPLSTRIENTTDPEICGKTKTLEDLVVSPRNRGIRYAIASLRTLSPEAFPKLEPARIELDNADCQFSPHASVATVGSAVEVVNRDPLLHTTHFYGPAETNFSLPMEGMRRTVRLERPGLYLVKCDIHGWMQAFIRVDPHPYHAVTDENGVFRIDGVPVGHHVLEVWHEKLGDREVDVRVETGETLPVLVEYPYEPS